MVQRAPIETQASWQLRLSRSALLACALALPTAGTVAASLFLSKQWMPLAHRLHIVLMTQYWPAEINLTLRESPAAAVYADLGLWPAGPRTSLLERRANARLLN